MGSMELPTAEVLPGIGDHSVIYHNGEGYYYVCKDYLTTFEDRELHCMVGECEGQASVAHGVLLEKGTHFHNSDLVFRDKCVLLHTIRQRFLHEDIAPVLILQDVLDSVSPDDDVYKEEESVEESLVAETKTEQEESRDLGCLPDEVFREDPVEEVEVRSMDGQGDEEQIILERAVFNNTTTLKQDRPSMHVPRFKIPQEPKPSSPKKVKRTEVYRGIDPFTGEETEETLESEEFNEPEADGLENQSQDHQYYEESPRDSKGRFDLTQEGPVLTPRTFKRMSKLAHRRRVIADKNGYIYTCNRNDGKNMYLVCSKHHTKGCHARAILRANGQIEVKKEYAHNHLPNYGKVASREFTAVLLEQMRLERGAGSDRPLKEVYNEMLVLYADYAPYVNYDQVRRAVRRANLII